LAEPDFDNVEDILVRWDWEYDFSQLHHFNNNDPLNIESIEKKYVEVMKSKTVLVSYNILNERQKIAHNMTQQALNLEENNSKTDGGSGISRL